MYVWADRSLLYMLFREGFIDIVIFDQNFERSERISYLLCGGILFRVERKLSIVCLGQIIFGIFRNSKEDSKVGVI